MLTNLPNFCRNSTHNFDSEPVEEFLHLCNSHPKSCKYSSHVIRFALQLRYTSHAAYRLLHHHIPLPSERLTVARNGYNLEVAIWVRDSALNYIIYLWKIISVESIGIIRFFIWLQKLKL